jgi:putative FmdB family regulatory protein
MLMAIYQFKCEEHGDFDVVQEMNAVHKAICPICEEEARRVYTPIRMRQKIKMGNTRQELFSNLAKEGFAHPDYEQHDSYLHAARGEPEKESNLIQI